MPFGKAMIHSTAYSSGCCWLVLTLRMPLADSNGRDSVRLKAASCLTLKQAYRSASEPLNVEKSQFHDQLI